MTTFFAALAVTICIEGLIVVIMRGFSQTLRARPTLWTCVFLNLLTHPLAVLATLTIPIPMLMIELVVMITELLGYRNVAGIPTKTATGLSLLTNTVSMVIGIATTGLEIV